MMTRPETMSAPTTIDGAWNWKRFALKWLAVGLGIGLIAVMAVGSLIWYSSRPKPWNANALIVRNPPGFSVADGTLQFGYRVKNTTESDYRVEPNYIESNNQVKILIKTSDGSLSHPFSDKALHIEGQIFIPAKQTGTVVLQLTMPGIPTKDNNETDDEYHERVRAFCENHLNGVKGFALFDETNRYRVDFPRWLSERPKKDSA